MDELHNIQDLNSFVHSNCMNVGVLGRNKQTVYFVTIERRYVYDK